MQKGLVLEKYWNGFTRYLALQWNNYGNIRYGRLDATDDEVIASAKEAQVHHFIQTLPDSYNLEINEETSNISEGQKQLLTIARAILKTLKF